jgi:hypothetical protein
LAYQQKDMEGSLFKNEKRDKDTHPHMQGSCTIEGVKYWISAWTNDGGEKGRWQGLKFKRADEKQVAAPKKGGSSNIAGTDLEDDIPF